MSLDIIKLLEDRDTYDKYIHVIKKNKLFSDKHKLIFNGVEKYYTAFPDATEIEWEKFETWFWVSHPVMKPEKKDLYNTIIESLKTLSLDEDLKENTIQQLVVRNYAMQIADKALRISDGEDIELDEITTVIDQFHEETKELNNNHIVTSDLDVIIQNTLRSGGLNWRLDYLNQMVGPIRKGDLIVIGTRPETGKTTFLASEGTNFISQMKEDEKLVWFNNEEEGQKVKLRIVQAALGWETERFETTPAQEILEEYERVTGRTVKDSIVVFDKAKISLRDISRTLKDHKAGVVVFDQLRKVSAFHNNSNELARLASLYQFARGIAKEVAPVITVHQARGDAEGVRWIAQNQLEGSQTEIQGEIDLQIMIGKSVDPSLEYNRFFNIVKNKLSGGPHVNKKLRHGQFECMLNPDIARYEMPNVGGVRFYE